MQRWLSMFVVMMLVFAVPAAAKVNCDAKTDHYAAGLSALDAGEYTTAIESFDCVLLATPDNADALWGKVEAQIMALWLEDAPYFIIADLFTLDESAPELIDAAIEQATAAITADPKALEPYIIRAQLYWWRAQDDLALLDYEQIIALNPNLATAYAYRGSSNLYMGNTTPDPTTDFERAFSLAPNVARLRTLMATTLLDIGEAQRALEPANAAVEIAPDLAIVYTIRGNVQRALGDSQAAIANYSRVLELEPDNIGALSARAGIYAAMGDRAAAQADFERATDISNEESLYYDLALGYEAGGDMPTAAGVFAAMLDTFRGDVIEGAPLSFGKAVRLELTEGRQYRLPVALQAGQMIDISAISPDDAADVILVLLAPDGSAPIYNDDIDFDNGDLNSLIGAFAVTQTGTYTLLVSHAGGNTEGAVDVLLTPTE